MAQAPVAHPLGPPTLSSNTISVDLALKQPTRVTRMLMDITKQRFILDRVFASAGGVTGGAVVYDQQTQNEIYLARDVQKVEPGSEFPIVTSDRLAPNVAYVEKWGGKIFITREARTRNDSTYFTNEVRKLANTIVRKLNQKAIDVLDTSITATSQSFSGRDWTDVVVGGADQSSAELWPSRDFIHAQTLADEDELAVNIDTWLINPAQYESLAIIYGAQLGDVLASFGIGELYSSNRVTAGTAYALAKGQVGEMRLEEPLQSESWYEERTQRTWLQSFVLPVMYVTNPYSVFKVTGLAG